MERTVQHAGRRSLRDVMMDTIELIESLPLMRPRWVALDVAIVVLLIFH